jgi:hypothetical protein
MFFAALFVFMLAGAGLSTTASAGCTLGVPDCRKGQLWVCERCGSETCWIYKGTRCHRDTFPDAFLGVQLDQPAQVLTCSDGLSAIELALHGAQVRQPVPVRVAAVEIAAAPIAVPSFD